MPRYYYNAMDATGREIESSVDAVDENTAQTIIRQMGYFITKIGVDKPESLVTMRQMSSWALFKELLSRFKPRLPTKKCSCCTGECND